MKEQIEQVFANIEGIPLFYIESGSRLWGIASPDSDFDVRGFHLQSKRQFYDFKKHRDIIEYLDGDFDFVSYDIDKMFRLLSKSNPTVFEWIRANIIYFNHLPEWIRLQEQIIEHFDFKALFYHYKSLSKGHLKLLETGKKFTYKTMFYCVRGLLSADLATRKIIPELLINDLFEQFDDEKVILKMAKDSLEMKKQQMEKQEIPEQSRQEMLTAIKNFVEALEFKVSGSSNNRQKLETVLTDYSQFIKTKYYR